MWCKALQFTQNITLRHRDRTDVQPPTRRYLKTRHSVKVCILPVYPGRMLRTTKLVLFQIAVSATVCWLQAGQLVYAQQADTLSAPSLRLTKLPPAQDLEVDEEGNIYLLDREKDVMYKYYKSVNYDTAARVGGKGISGERFSEALKITVPARNLATLLDIGTQRIVLMSVNLRMVQAWSFGGRQFLNPESSQQMGIFPLSYDMLATGELFVLNQEDYRVYRLDANLRPDLVFAGPAYGEGSVYNPVDVVAGADNFQQPLVYVTDTVAQQVKAYNQFGIFQFTLAPQLPFRWRTANAWAGRMILAGPRHVAVINPASGGLRVWHTGHPTPLLDAEARKEGLYLLFENEVHLYPN